MSRGAVRLMNGLPNPIAVLQRRQQGMRAHQAPQDAEDLTRANQKCPTLGTTEAVARCVVAAAAGRVHRRRGISRRAALGPDAACGSCYEWHSGKPAQPVNNITNIHEKNKRHTTNE